MQQSFQLQQWEIDRIAKEFKPTAMHLDFFRSSGGFETGWQLVAPQIYTNQSKQRLVKNSSA